MKRADSILIHAGCESVGMAAISIALNMKCTVFTTVSTQFERTFLKETFPHLAENHIGYFQNASFEEFVLNATNRQGVTFVLNCLLGDLMQASLGCLRKGGHFLDLSTGDSMNKSQPEISFVPKNQSFHVISLANVFHIENELKSILKLIEEGISSGDVMPLPNIVFDENEIQKAFNHFISTKHSKKVLLRIRKEETELICLPTPKIVCARARSYFSTKKTYIIVGGLGGFGLELANWLIERGAKYIILTSRSGITTGYQRACIKRWTDANVTIVVSNKPATTEDNAKSLLQEAANIGVIGGIFNLAFVLRDALIENQTADNFHTVCVPKVVVSQHLDAASRELAPKLDHFVIFSSIAAAKGNLGQTTYGFANSACERLCEERQKIGLPGLAIQWGVIGDVGYVVENVGYTDTEIAGTKSQPISSCLAVFDVFMQQNNPVVTSIVLATSGEIVRSIPLTGLLETVTKIVGIKDTSNISNTVTLVELGMDSLMETEIKQIIERNYGVVFTSREIRDLTLSKLAELNSELEFHKSS